ncbi:hypothetical protein JCGZ_16134 [Jatropha curcas]|uniref:Lactate/malate dehydrogenase C-terminal domain-containing protein n=1 Tax=Jatropha curcas TaxID=180498 RepID=A0A067KFW5_JATCU|nr:hypothetical protein JCGZ_16134 [Jatropha curcas]
MAYATVRFVESSLHVLDGDGDVYECSFVQSDLADLPFFASRVKLGRMGLQAIISSDLQGLTEYEQKTLENLKPELKANIEKGIAFAQKQPMVASRERERAIRSKKQSDKSKAKSILCTWVVTYNQV